MSTGHKVKRIPQLGPVDLGGAITVLALSALFYIAAVRPSSEHRVHVAAERKSAGDTLQRRISMIQDELRQAKAQEAVLRNNQNGPTLEPVSALNRRLARIADLAAALKLDLADMRPGTASSATAASRCITLPISVDGVGTFRGCAEYLHALHDQLPDVAVTAFNLSAIPGKTDDSPGAKFALELRWYAAAPAASAASTLGSPAAPAGGNP